MKESKPEKFVVFQFPNKFIWAMLVSWLLAHFSTGLLHSASRGIFITAGIIWSYEEIVHGANWFRETLGVVVLLFLAIDIVRG